MNPDPDAFLAAKRREAAKLTGGSWDRIGSLITDILIAANPVVDDDTVQASRKIGAALSSLSGCGLIVPEDSVPLHAGSVEDDGVPRLRGIVEVEE